MKTFFLKYLFSNIEGAQDRLESEGLNFGGLKPESPYKSPPVNTTASNANFVEHKRDSAIKNYLETFYNTPIMPNIIAKYRQNYYQILLKRLDVSYGIGRDAIHFDAARLVAEYSKFDSISAYTRNIVVFALFSSYFFRSGIVYMTLLQKCERSKVSSTFEKREDGNIKTCRISDSRIAIVSVKKDN
ncbi:hypothetical protein HELRODRAFT_178198 [Helobdella robusta]|uniref:Uncharacterized protein n=1 Tax=Helobdella robusta TaxID=6412 RepID=T1FCX5_HELRO|nr:hypothetical protein HELRODRAFT_178198 [Helobdella robusta]ESN97407.1 hypothetical protein HELRODRAFT_178198 [Helobdella robusta]